jgi:hypothetical protein
MVIRFNWLLWVLGLGAGFACRGTDGLLPSFFLLVLYTFVLRPLITASGLWLRSFDIDDEHSI